MSGRVAKSCAFELHAHACNILSVGLGEKCKTGFFSVVYMFQCCHSHGSLFCGVLLLHIPHAFSAFDDKGTHL